MRDRKSIIEQAQKNMGAKQTDAAAETFANDLARAAQDAVARRKAGYVDESRTVVKPKFTPVNNTTVQTPVLDSTKPKKIVEPNNGPKEASAPPTKKPANLGWVLMSDEDRAKLIADYNDTALIQQAADVNRQYDEKMAAFTQANDAYNAWLKKSQSEEMLNAISENPDDPKWESFREEGDRLFAEAKKYDDEADALRAQADGLHDQALFVSDMRILNDLLPKLDEATRNAFEQRANGVQLTNSSDFYSAMQKYGYSQADTERLMQTWKRFKNKEGMEAFEQTVQGMARVAPGINSISSVASNVVAPYTGFAAAALAGLSSGEYRSADPNGWLFAPTVYSDTVRQTVAEDISGENGNLIREGAARIYSNAMGVADNILRGIMYGERGTEVMAMDVFQRTMRNASLRGASAGEAMAIGFAAAALEYATEQGPFNNMLEILDDGVEEFVKQGAKEAAEKAGKEFAKKLGLAWVTSYGEELPQELISYWGNAAAEAIILRQKSDFNQNVSYFMAEKGMSKKEAEAEAWRELLEEGTLGVAFDTAFSTLFQVGFAQGVNQVMKQAERSAKDEQTTQTDVPAEELVKPIKVQQGETVDTEETGSVLEEIITKAKETNAVTNSQANAILQNPQAVEVLQRLTGMELPGTASANRGAVKAAVLEVASDERAAQESNQALTPADDAALKLAQLTETKDYPGVDTGTETIYNDDMTEEGGNSNGSGLQQDDGAGSVGDSAQGMAGLRETDGTESQRRNEHGALAIDSGVVRVSEDLQKAQMQKGTPVYKVHDTTDMPDAYATALENGRNSDAQNGWCVTPKSAEELREEGVRTFMNENGTVGVGVKPNGDIVAVFKNKKGGPKRAMDTAMPIAIEQGGDRLDCYGEGLVGVYARYGFVPVARVEFNPEYANPGWTPDKNTPYIYFMMHNGDSAATVAKKMGAYPEITKAQLDALPTYGKEDYDAAMEYRDGLIEQKEQPGGFAMGAADSGFDQYSHLQYQYGNKKDRKDAVRYTNVPNRDKYGRIISDFSSNVYSYGITEKKEMVEELERRIAEGEFGADIKTQKDTIDRAMDEIMAKNGDTKVTAQIVSAVAEGRTSDDLVAKGLCMYTYLQHQSRFAEAGEMAVYLSDLLRTAGRTLNLAKLTRSLTPEGQWAARKALYAKAQKTAERKNKSKKKVEIKPNEQAEKDFQNVATAEETAVTETERELKQHLKADAKQAARKAAKAADKAAKQVKNPQQQKPKLSKTDVDRAAAAGVRAGTNAAKEAMQTEAPTQEQLYSAIMDFIRAKKKKVSGKKNAEKSLRSLMQYYQNSDNFKQAWWAARRQADLAVSGDEKARAILDEFLYSADAMMEGDEQSAASVARKAAREAAAGAGIDVKAVVTETLAEKQAAMDAVSDYVGSQYAGDSAEMVDSVAEAFRVELAQRRDAIFEKENGTRDVMRRAAKESGYQLNQLLTAPLAQKQEALAKMQAYVDEHYTMPDEESGRYNDQIASEFYKELAQRRDAKFVADGGSRAVMRKAANETGASLAKLLAATQGEKQAALEKMTKWVAEHYNLLGEDATMLDDLIAEEYYGELTERRAEKLKDEEKQRRTLRAAAKEAEINLNDLITESLQNRTAALDKIQAYVEEHYAMPAEQATELAKTMQDAFFAELAERQTKRLEAMFAPKEDKPKAEPKSTAQKLRELAAMGAFKEDNEISRAALKNLFGADGLQISPDLMEYYADLSDAKRAEVDARIVQDIADQMGGDLAGAFRKLRFGGMLLNPSTHINNLVGNAGQSAVQLLGSDTIAAIIEGIVDKATGGKIARTKAVLNFANKADRDLYLMAATDYGTLLKNKGEVAQKIANGGRYDRLRNDVEKARRVIRFNKEGKVWDKINAALGVVESGIDLNSEVMGVEDALFSKNAYAMSLAMYMKANNLTEITDAAREYAIERAQICTLHDDSVLYQKMVKHLPKAVVEAELPFLKTGANVADRMFTYSPGGFIKFGFDLLQMAKYKGGDSEHAQKMLQKYTGSKAISDLSSGVVGTAILFAGIALANAGLLRMNGTGSEEEREYEELMGAKPNSAFVNGEWVDMSNLSPISGSLFAGAALYETIVNAADGNGSFEDVLSAFFSVTDPMMDMSIFSGLDGLVYAVKYAPEDENIFATVSQELITSYLNQFVPSFARKIAYAVDNMSRKAYNEGFLSSEWQELEAQIPGLRENVNQKYDIWGQPIAYSKLGGDDALGAILRTVSPTRVYDVHETELDPELKRLMSLGYDVLPTDANAKHITVSTVDAIGDKVSEKVKLTADQYDVYQRVEGQGSYQMAKLLMENEAFQELPDEYKAKALNMGYDHADNLGKEAALSAYEYDLPNWLEGGKAITEEVAASIIAKVQKDYAGLTDKRHEAAAKYGFTDEAASEIATAISRYKNLHQDGSKYKAYKAIAEAASGKDRDNWLRVYGMSESALEELQKAERGGMSAGAYFDLLDTANAAAADLKPENGRTEVRDIQKLEALMDLGGLTPAEKKTAAYSYLSDAADAKMDKLTGPGYGLTVDQFVDTYRAYLDRENAEDGKRDIAAALGRSVSDPLVEKVWKAYQGK